MTFLLLIGCAAAILGALAAALFKSRPRRAMVAVALLPPLLLLVRYMTYVRANDWEGMGALSGLILSAGWVMISLTAGVAVLTARRRMGTLPTNAPGYRLD